ncbi:aspartate racemase [Alkalibacillus flavidus]|uniref:Aspartate racemase n=1 Tax=Alkalibacillus flavidus TaxID=546021 RepID=A0ABV2KTS4_9BACI
MTKEKTIGIVGGLGPKATIDLYQKIVNNTPVNIEQDHLRIIIDSNPKIPCRVEAINNNGVSPLPSLIGSSLDLERYGADFLIMPCHTAHYFVDKIEKEIMIPFVSMIDVTIDYLVKNNYSKIGIIGTSALLNTDVYQRKLMMNDLDYLTPTQPEIDEVMSNIFEFKRQNTVNENHVSRIAKNLLRSGAQVVLLACTELPFLIEDQLKGQCIDPTDILALQAIKKAKGTEI